MKVVTADDGAQLHVSVRGHGPPVVLLHSWAANHDAWGAIGTELAHRFTVHAWDARGHGRSAAAGHAPPVVARMARDVRVLLAHFGLERPTLVAHSMGALTLWQMVADGGCTGIGRVCIIDQSPRLITDDHWQLGIYGDWPAERNRAFMAALRTDFPETVLRLLADGHNEKARHQVASNTRGIQRLRDALARLDPEPLIACWDSLGQADYRPVLPLVTVPTLLVYGTASNYYGSETAHYVADRIPSAALHLFEGADHSPHLAERERFLALLSAFIAEGTSHAGR